jgi:hypothetical protein
VKILSFVVTQHFTNEVDHMLHLAIGVRPPPSMMIAVLTTLLVADMYNCEGPEKATRGGVNGSLSKFHKGTWPIFQIEPDTLFF